MKLEEFKKIINDRIAAVTPLGNKAWSMMLDSDIEEFNRFYDEQIFVQKLIKIAEEAISFYDWCDDSSEHLEKAIDDLENENPPAP